MEIYERRRGSILKAIVSNLIGSSGSITLYQVGKHFALLRDIAPDKPVSVRARRGASRIRSMLRDAHCPGSEVVWDLFEAMRRAGLTWSSGFLGLFAASYPADAVGIIWCMRSQHYGDPWWGDRLLSLVFHAPIAMDWNRREVEWEASSADDIAALGDSVFERRSLRLSPTYLTHSSMDEARQECTLEAPLLEALENARVAWYTTFPNHELHSVVTLDSNFPAQRYAIALDERRTLRERYEMMATDRFWDSWIFGTPFGAAIIKNSSLSDRS